MSRSYRHVPGYNDRDPHTKKLFNRKIRRTKMEKYQDIPNGNAYKKLNNSWDICDFKSVNFTFEQAKFWNNQLKNPDSDEELWAYWIRTYFSK